MGKPSKYLGASISPPLERRRWREKDVGKSDEDCFSKTVSRLPRFPKNDCHRPEPARFLRSLKRGRAEIDLPTKIIRVVIFLENVFPASLSATPLFLRVIAAAYAVLSDERKGEDLCIATSLPNYVTLLTPSLFGCLFRNLLRSLTLFQTAP